MQSSAGPDNGGTSQAADAPRRRTSVTNLAIQSLRERLAQEVWSPGDRLPSEPTLAKELGVSRVSVRGALARLESEGVVNRRHGSGTYVNSVRPLVRSLHLNIGAEELIKSGGHTPGIAEMSWRQEEASEVVAQRLGIAPSDPVIHLYRVRTSDGKPVTISHDYFSTSLLPEQPVSLGSSLYAFLKTVCGVEVTFGVATLEPSTVGDDHATVFDVSAGEMCLVIKQVDYAESEKPVSYSEEYHLASEFDFQIIRQGPAGMNS